MNMRKMKIQNLRRKRNLSQKRNQSQKKNRRKHQENLEIQKKGKLKIMTVDQYIRWKSKSQDRQNLRGTFRSTARETS